MKDEIHNIKPLFESVSGCFDEIHLTDTGSTDGTIEFAQSEEASTLTGCPITVKHFKWIDDFAAARNYSMDGVTTDYVMWLDLDDALSDKEAFIKWRNEVMLLADFWLAPYHYAFDDNKRPVCTFLRERVIKTAKKFSWKYFIHEGMIADEPVQAQVATNWAVNHRRTIQDYEKDFSRNVSMLEKRAKTEELPPRLKWYYGKELADKGRWAEAYTWLDNVCDNPSLELHDRILAYEYLVRSCLQRFFTEQAHRPDRDMSLVAKGFALAMQGATLNPSRAEFYCLAADCLLQMGRDIEALPLYGAAASTPKPSMGAGGFLFVNHAAYEHIPKDQIARIKFKMGDLDGAISMATDSFKLYGNQETEKFLKELLNLKEKDQAWRENKKEKTTDIVFTCIQGSHPYPFDEEIYESKGIGGSETALVEVARAIKKKTGARVIVFNTRESEKVCSSGVEYKPSQTMYDYFTKYEPKAHVAWRHNVKLTNAPTFLWCHDLYTPHGEKHETYNAIIALSEFHKNYLQVLQNIPDKKIVISRNGVNKSRFEGLNATKNENKIVFPSSPDRGLERAIDIVEKARLKSGRDLELHVYYGFENMRKMPQMKPMLDMLEKKISERPWVKYHGNVDQKTLARELSEAVVWLYPANFIETYCITVLEAMYAKCFPLVREIGALKNTARPFHDKGWAKLLFLNAETDQEKDLWANQLLYVLDERAWEKIDMSEFDYSWSGVADQFIELCGLKGEILRTKLRECADLDANTTV